MHGNHLLLFLPPYRSTFPLLRGGEEAGSGINSTQGDADLCSDISSCSPASSSIRSNVGPRLANRVNEPGPRLRALLAIFHRVRFPPPFEQITLLRKERVLWEYVSELSPMGRSPEEIFLRCCHEARGGRWDRN